LLSSMLSFIVFFEEAKLAQLNWLIPCKPMLSFIVFFEEAKLAHLNWIGTREYRT
jgi:hypothetical protein